jgi:hypothetical protein
MDLEPGDISPKPGDFVLTIGKRRTVNSVYLVKDSRAVKRRDPAGAPRQALICYRSTRDDATLARRDGATLFHLIWNPRNKKL